MPKQSKTKIRQYTLDQIIHPHIEKQAAWFPSHRAKPNSWQGRETVPMLQQQAGLPNGRYLKEKPRLDMRRKRCVTHGNTTEKHSSFAAILQRRPWYTLPLGKRKVLFSSRGEEGVSIPRTNPKRFFIPPLLYSTVVVSPAFLAVMWRLILPLSPYTQTHTHTHSQALEFRGVHSQYPMELYIFCNLISMPAPVPVLWMGEEEVQARNSLDLADFSQEKPVNAAPRGKMVIIAWR